MRILKFQIRHNTGQIEQINVETERVLIGSGAHCEIRLPLDQARVEHVLIELGPAGVFARALSFEPAPMINNIPFTQAPLPPESVLGVNQVQIQVMVAEGELGAGGSGQEKKKASPGALIALLLMLPAAGYLFLVDDEPTGMASAAPKQPPELWDAAGAQCPHTGGQASAFAQEQMQIADAKRERRPFHVQDGIQAVPIYEKVATCFRAGGDPQSAALAEEASKYLRREITEDFRTRRVRLEHALAVQDYASAQKEVRILLQFVEGKTGDYVTWLSNLDRNLKLRVGRQDKN
ncbi:MAG: hypothetical protein KC657_20930 [Myxococcales bacterium]|nr:hypothetical protein [Myxococcales bacterium]